MRCLVQVSRRLIIEFAYHNISRNHAIVRLDEVRLRHASKMSSMDDKIMRARQKVEKEKAESQNQSLQTFASIGGAVLSAVLGRRLASSSSIGRAVTSMRSAGRAAKQQADVAHAEESLTVMEEKKAVLEADVYQELDRIRLDSSPDQWQLKRSKYRLEKWMSWWKRLCWHGSPYPCHLGTRLSKICLWFAFRFVEMSVSPFSLGCS